MPRFRVKFTPDSKRRGDQETAASLAKARAIVSKQCGERVVLEKTRTYGYPRSWQTVCGDTVTADIFELPKGASDDFFPKYNLARKPKRKGRKR